MALLSSADGCGKECNICYEFYQEVSTKRVPKLLWCSHTVCLACVRKLVCQSRVVSFVVCPFCRMVTLVPQGDLQALRNNEALLREIGPPGAEASQATFDDGLKEDKDSTRVSNWSFGLRALRDNEILQEIGPPKGEASYDLSQKEERRFCGQDVAAATRTHIVLLDLLSSLA
uniref:RING-type domain-containing protein n=1 Tax=Laticauda laticaudata TaxID=8630 RepID=A0A8C5RSN2_LATLA